MNTKATSILVPTAVILLLSSVSAHADCANLPGMRLTAKQNHLSLNDNAPICVTLKEDGTIDFMFKITIANPVQVNAGEVRVRQKDSSPQPQVEITGDNVSPVNKIKVHVQGTGELDDEFGFLIEVDGIGLLDPTVRVVDSGTQRTLQAYNLQEVADAWLLSPEEIADLTRLLDKQE
jgi:biopolymer transport protein ExbD